MFRNPVIDEGRGEDHGDPFVLRWADGYYLYHTGRDRVHLYTSADLVRWEYEGAAVEAGPVGHWAEVDLWAPEVLHRGGTFFMYVAGTRRKAEGGAGEAPGRVTPVGADRPLRGDDGGRRLGLARAEGPRGPFVWDPVPLVGGEWSIDGHPFADEDGALWLFYNVRNEATRGPGGVVGCGNVVDRLVAPEVLEGRPSAVAVPDARWEGNRAGTWFWCEGPCVLRRRGVYHQMYSGGWFGDDTYAVGVASAPRVRGPWRKYAGNPVLKGSAGMAGPGHHSVVVGPDGATTYAVYHAYVPGQRGRKVCVDQLFWCGDRPVVIGPTDGDQPVPAGPVYDRSVPWWHASAWVAGEWVEVAGVRLELGNGPGYRAVEAVHGLGGLTLRVDGAVRWTGPLEIGAGPAVRALGEVRGLTVTSRLDDDGVYALGPGDARAWAWGGRGPLEVAVAARGRVAVRAGAAAVEGGGAAVQGWMLVRLWAPGGAEGVEVVAGPEGAEVADVVIAARE